MTSWSEPHDEGGKPEKGAYGKDSRQGDGTTEGQIVAKKSGTGEKEAVDG